MKKLGVQVAAFLAIGLMLWGVFAWRDRSMLKKMRDEMAVARRDTVIVTLTDTLRQRDSVYLAGRTVYRDAVRNPGSTRDDIIRTCNQVVLSCDSVRATNGALRDSLTAQVAALRAMKARKPPRLSAFALGGYDWLNGRPLAQLGGEARIVGALSLVGYIEAAQGPADEKLQTRGVVAAKFTFR